MQCCQAVNRVKNCTPEEERVLIYAPFGKDAHLAAEVLKHEKMQAEVCSNARELIFKFQHGAGVLLMTEEVLLPDDFGIFLDLLKQQPPWSDIPIIVLTSGGELTKATLRRLEVFGPSGNVTLIERPFRIITLTSAVQVAMRARYRQYEVRNLIDRLKQSHEDLERRVEERTADLARANEELKRSNQELEMFAYVASHDLQEPLRMISGYSQLVEGQLPKDANSEISYLFGFIRDGVKRMHLLIGDLLAFSRLRSRNVNLDKVDLGVVLENIKKDMQVKIVANEASITHTEMPVVEGDWSQLYQLFQNLISNAIKFRRDEAPPKIHISSHRQNGCHYFSVEDNGIGIESMYFEKIFTIFQRLHSKDKFPGTGIGLAICKKVVQHHGGKIWLESEIGKGTTFKFNLPVKQNPRDHHGQEKPGRSKDQSKLSLPN